MKTNEYQHEIAQLAHVELLTPKPEQTLWFFRDLLGLVESGRDKQSVYLRAYEDWYHHSLKITEAPEAGLGHVAWRTMSEAALDRRAKALMAGNEGGKWIDGDLGHGRAYRFRDPDGHLMELLWDVEYYTAPPEQRTPLLCRPQRRPLHGVPVRRLDHVNLMASNAGACSQFMQKELGFKLRERVVGDDGAEVMGAWLSVSSLVHEVAYMADMSGARGRLHHICYWYGVPQHVYDLAEVLRENEVKIEAGPGKHGITQALFMYVYEPGGNRIELFSDTGYLIFDPLWKPITWTMTQAAEAGLVWVGAPLPDSFWSYGTPLVSERTPTVAEKAVPVIS